MLTEIKNRNYHYFDDGQGRKQGEYKEWWSNGRLGTHCFYINNVMHGEFKEWHDNGLKWVECFYVNGNQHGEYKLWWQNGQLKVHAMFVNGKRHGEYKWYDYNGHVHSHCFFIDGVVALFDKIPYPATPEERMIFKLKCDIPLLPLE